MRKIYLSLILAFLSMSLMAQNNDEEQKSSFLKRLDLVLGGSLNISNSNDPQNLQFASNPFNLNPLGVGSYSAYNTESSTFNPRIYSGIKFGENFIIGAEIEFGDANNLLDYSAIFGAGTVYYLERESTLNKKGVFLRYLIPISDRFEFGLQPSGHFASLNSVLTTYIANSSSSNSTIEEEDYDYFEFGLSANVIFKVFDRFNLIVAFGKTRFTKGDWSSTTLSYVDGIQEGDPLIRERSFEAFDMNFNSSTLFIGIEAVF